MAERPAITMQPPAILGFLTSRSETLVERLARLAARQGDGAAPPGYKDLDPAAIRQLLAPWSKAFARGRYDALYRRLAWDGWAPERAALAFRRSETLPPTPEVLWTAELVRYVEQAQALVDRSADRRRYLESWRRRAGDTPFLELWLPWIRSATASLAVRPAGGGPAPSELLASHLAAPARQDLQAHLLVQIARLSELAAYELFKRRPGEQGYDDFVAETLRDPLNRLYQPFPVLARQSAETVRQWREAATELVRHLDADRSALAETFGGGEPPGRVRTVRAGLSDRHGDGRQVMVLEFESGLSLVYKPRSLGLERAFEQWLRWCAAQGFELSPRAPRVLARQGYGWQELVGQQRLEHRGEAARYFRRAGALIAFAYALRAEDLHAENLIATRDGPVVVDAEMLLQPLRARISTRPEAGCANGAGGGSCLVSGLLIQPGRGDRGRSREWGGLRPELQRHRGSGRRWREVNSDRMSFEPEAPRGELGENVLWVGETPAVPEDYGDEIADGFERAYRFLLKRRQALLAAGGPLDFFRGTEVRILLRPSQEYGTVLALAAVPRNQRSGLGQGLLHEALLSSFADGEDRPLLWPLVAEERSSLAVRDIPRFAVAADAADVRTTSGELVAGHFSVSGLDAVRDRIGAFGDTDCRRQLKLLRRALQPPESLVCLAQPPADPRPSAALDPGELEERCGALARNLGDEIVTWRLLERLPRWAWPIRRGRIGVALLFAALAREHGATDRAETVRVLVAPIAQELSKAPPESVLTDLGLGGFSGLGSLVYGLTWLGRLLDDADLLELAGSAARRIDAEKIGRDRDFDLEAGASGALLGLLALYQTTCDAGVLERARACAEHLLAHQEMLTSGGASWRNAGGLALAGWTHGAGGIARALATLGEIRGEERFRVAAAAALGYERSLFDRERANWPMLTRAAGEAPSEGGGLGAQNVSGRLRRSWRVAWCHGAPGVALSRLMLPPSFGDETVAAELDVALATTASAPPNELDHLCCGTLGRSAVLLAAAHRQAGPERLAAARRLTASVLDRALAGGSFSLRTDRLRSRELQPGFLQGLAGIGYHLLRMSGAAELPDVLALELPSEVQGRRSGDVLR